MSEAHSEPLSSAEALSRPQPGEEVVVYAGRVPVEFGSSVSASSEVNILQRKGADQP